MVPGAEREKDNKEKEAYIGLAVYLSKEGEIGRANPRTSGRLSFS